MLGRFVTALLIVAAIASVEGRQEQEHPRAPHRHAGAEKLANPEPRTPDSVREGGEIYAKACANCHGANGLGNGRLSAAMAAYGARPSNLTDGDWQHGASDGEIFTSIRAGIGPDFHMPAYEGRLADAQIWHVVNFIRTLGS